MGRRQVKGITFILFKRKKNRILDDEQSVLAQPKKLNLPGCPRSSSSGSFTHTAENSFAVSSSPSLSLISAFHSALPLWLSILLAPLFLSVAVFLFSFFSPKFSAVPFFSKTLFPRLLLLVAFYMELQSIKPSLEWWGWRACPSLSIQPSDGSWDCPLHAAKNCSVHAVTLLFFFFFLN